jgi:hypothetical protein
VRGLRATGGKIAAPDQPQHQATGLDFELSQTKSGEGPGSLR